MSLVLRSEKGSKLTIKSYYANDPHPYFVEGEIYECFRAVLQSMAITTDQYRNKYKYPHKVDIPHEEFERHFISLDIDRSQKIDSIL